MKKVQTEKSKVKVIGTETYINQQTGELIEMEVIEKEERDYNFHKLWLGHIVQALDIIGNKKIKVVNHILSKTDSQNLFIGTQREIAKDLDVSITTVNETLKALQESDFLIQVQQGVYRVNPNVIYKGSRGGRMNVLIKYTDEKVKQGDVDENK